MSPILPCVAFALLGVFVPSARAADLVLHQQPPGASDAAFSWTGAYVGIQGGYQWGRDSTTEFAVGGPPTGFFEDFTTHGGFGGVHAGYNYQINRFVVGVEADVELARIRAEFTVAPGFLHFDAEQDWQASVRGRLGVAPVDRLLLYVTGGAAFTDLKYTWTNTDPFVPSSGQSADLALVGWTLGGGGEFAFTNHITARLEYRYTDFGSPSFDWPAVGGSYVEHPRIQAVRAGITYKF